jgi:Na+/H+ antiporter NhaC
LGSNLAVLAGAMIGRSTFGDNIAPIFDIAIAGTLTQKADVGATVRSPLKYVVPSAAIAMFSYFIY